MNSNDYTEMELQLIYKNVLHNMHDGVLAIDSNGKIITSNPAANDILKINVKKYIGEPFTNIFSELLLDPRNDQLSDAILNTIYESSVTHHKDVKYYHHGACKELLVSSTALLFENDGITEKIGMILVLTDITRRQRLARIQSLFGKYVDSNIANRLINQSEDELMKANRQDITVSFCDMNNFTSLCETLSASAMEQLMNIFLTKMSRSVHKNHGVIDKFIGDAVMSFWGFPFVEGDNHVKRGCQTALEQMGSLVELNEELKLIKEIENIQINIGIGIASGELIVANVGSEERKSFTVMGNIVNLAARLVGVNKLYGTRILVTDDVFKSTSTDFDYREIDTIVVKGKEQHTTIYELLDFKGSLSLPTIAFNDSYAKGLRYYRQQAWLEAKSHFEQALEIIPQNQAARVFLDRINHFIEQPPSIDWQGVWVLDRK